MASRLEPQNTAHLIGLLLKVDSISVCFSVAGIMDYYSILAYSLINIKVVFFKRLLLNSSRPRIILTAGAIAKSAPMIETTKPVFEI